MAQSYLWSTSSGSISASQFSDALRRSWLAAGRFRFGKATSMLPRKLGLAVSGGPDSMAMAYLCRQWEIRSRSENKADVSVTAFVVDHKARAESTQEANAVAGYLRDLGITTQILPLDWSGINNSAFETQARRLRFQALGQACRDHGIEALLLGHHQDDNVETTIWRLASGARGPGLAGIASSAKIPECHGLYGVSGSGHNAIVRPDAFIKPLQPTEQVTNEKQKFPPRRWNMAVGGILIHRPLLDFPKADLISTCHENNVPYVSDATNFDPSLTARNAIRSLVTSNSLPRALQKDSLLSLVDNCQKLARDGDRLSDNILRTQCKLVDFSLASGAITIQFKPSPPSMAPVSQTDPQSPSPSQIEQGISAKRLHQVQCLTLRRLTELACPFPDNHWQLSKFMEFTGRVFPSPSSTPDSSYTIGKTTLEISPRRKPGQKPPQDTRKAFTIGGIIFQPVTPQQQVPNSRLKKPTSTSTSARVKARGPRPNIQSQDHDRNTWLLSRQPYFRHREPVSRFDLPSLIPSTSSLSPSNTESLQHQQKQQPIIHIPWLLWDNRFWLRASLVPHHLQTKNLKDTSGSHPTIYAQSQESKTSEGETREGEKLQIVIRPFRESDLTSLRQQHGQPMSEHESQSRKQRFNAFRFLEKLDREAPGQSRFTIPVFALEGFGADMPLALPTLDLTFPDLGSMPWTLNWEWKYKMIDLEALRLMGLG